ncbi:uncharacterized protein LOC131257713 [Magnolia sinica]|uniref:uncharacterized protein LOC131257713 n=1 Tax=Magnolia sinica TaxID=86752 RepID=UPI00265A1A21|nr:uncharacterized protein LOC131257713 [Magnolia sinica]
MWEHLQSIYQQSNAARLYRLEQDLVTLTQGNDNIQSFYSKIVTIWTEMTMMDPTFPHDFKIFQTMRESAQVRQFLMKLRPEFEHYRAALLNRSPTPSLNSVINDLLAEEQRLKVLSTPGSSDMVLAVSTTPPTRGSGSSPLTCRGCNKVRHVVAQCKEWCAYCRRTGHGIQDCRTRAYASSFGRGRGGRGRGRGRALSATAATISSETSVSESASTTSAEGLSSPLTLAMLQQIVQALSAAGMSGSVNGEGTWEG